MYVGKYLAYNFTHLQSIIFVSVGLGPCELLTYISTVYVVSAVVLKLQVMFCGLISSHSLGDGGAGLILTVTESVGGVYINNEGIPYCSIMDDTVVMNTVHTHSKEYR